MNAPLTPESPASTTNTFELISSTEIASLNLICEEYQHKNTAAKHIHLKADNNENVFMVALRTVPTDSTGVAHILEHTSLCGSEKYPVRDPFFMMIRRSLNTFMNAFTSSDWTAYPFATQSKKDFDNLLSVYLDAVFFARLDPLDFAQEGYRIEFEESQNSDNDLVYKGVVFNEMKGAMSSISSQLWQAVGENLFPDTTYGHNSGGDPAAITDLSYEQLKTFYQTHYHPDNALFFTYGDISANEHQAVFESNVLSKFKHQQIHIEVPKQPRFTEPVRTQKPYAVTQEDNGDAALEKTHHVCAWVLDSIHDPFAVMATHLLASVLLENSASPLRYGLETTSLGKAPSPLCGADDSGLQMIFVCGLEGCAADTQADVEALITNILQDVANNPPSQERLSALLDQLELQQREITGDSYPFGLQIILSCIAAAMHRGDITQALNVDQTLTQLREAIAEPTFISDLVRRLFIDNPHRVTLSLQPDTDLAEQELKAEVDKLSQLKAGLSKDQAQQIINTTEALKQRQAEQDNPDLLPKVGLEDIPAPALPPKAKHNDKLRSHFYPQGTNGIAYHQLIAPLDDFSHEELLLLSLHDRLLTDLGVGNRSYLETQNWQSTICGGISAYHSLRPAIDNEQHITGFYTLSTKGLASKHNDLIALLTETFKQARFDEPQRIKELIAQSTARALRSVTGQGHGLAMTCAAQQMSPLAQLHHLTGGIEGIARLKQLDAALRDDAPSAIEALCDQLTTLNRKLCTRSTQFLSVAEARDEQAIYTAIQAHKANLKTELNTGQTQALVDLAPVRSQSREIWLCESQVNFCAKAYPSVPSGHEDAAALTVLAGVLRNGYLHTAIREQGGAYGGGASQDSSSACFRFYSYRDPRLADTLDDFDRAIDWLQQTRLPKNTVEEAILGVVSAIDKPASPASTAKQHFHNGLFGRTPQVLNAFRDRVIQVSESDIKRVAEQYLQPQKASIGIISHTGENNAIDQLSQQTEAKILTL